MVAGAKRDIVRSITIDRPPVQVWAELTKVGQKQRPMMDTVLETTLEPGTPILYKSEDGAHVFVAGRVLEVETEKRLSHNQILTMRDDPVTTVTWQLEADGDTTIVTLINSGFPPDTKGLNKIESTWKTILDDLKREVEDGSIHPLRALQYRAFGRLGFLLPSSTRTGNVKIPD